MVNARRVTSSPDFRLLWGGQFVSDLGGQLTVVALPCALVLLLGATPLQVGALQAVEWGVIPLFAIFAGVLVDRVRRRPLMVVANVVRLCALALLPLAALAHRLALWEFFAVAAVVGIASVVFDTAYQAHLPTLVDPHQLVEANEKMTIGASVAEVAGTSLCGAIVQSLGAPLAIALNAAGYVVATCALLRIRRPEPPPGGDGGAARSLRTDVAAGVRVVAQDPVLRVVGAASAVNHLALGIGAAVFYVYVFREAGLTPAALGLILAFANAGCAGAWFAGRIATRIGMRATLGGALAVAGLGMLLLPLLAHASPLVAILISRVLLTAAQPVFDVNQQTLRVQRVPAALQGRMNATMRTLVWGGLPLGSLLGGALGNAFGLVPALFVSGIVGLAAAALVVLVPPLGDEPASSALRAPRGPISPGRPTAPVPAH